MQSIDYSPLQSRPVGIGGRLKIPEMGLLKLIVAGLSSIVIIPLILVVLVVVGVIFTILPDVLWIIGIVILFGWFYWLAHAQQKREKRLLDGFVQANGWQEGGTLPINDELNKMGFKAGGVKFSGKIDSAPFFVHKLIYPNRGNGQSESPQEVLAIKVTATLPTLVFSPPISFISDSFCRLFGLERYTLEGDFNQYVHVLGNSGQQIEVLSYLTPDVMKVLTDNTSSVIMYIGDTIYISAAYGAQLTSQVMELVFSDGQKILREIQQKQG